MSKEIGKCERCGNPPESESDMDYFDPAIGIGGAVGIILAGTKILEAIEPQMDSGAEVLAGRALLGLASAAGATGLTYASSRVKARFRNG